MGDPAQGQDLQEQVQDRQDDEDPLRQGVRGEQVEGYPGVHP